MITLHLKQEIIDELKSTKRTPIKKDMYFAEKILQLKEENRRLRTLLFELSDKECKRIEAMRKEELEQECVS